MTDHVTYRHTVHVEFILKFPFQKINEEQELMPPPEAIPNVHHRRALPKLNKPSAAITDGMVVQIIPNKFVLSCKYFF